MSRNILFTWNSARLFLKRFTLLILPLAISLGFVLVSADVEGCQTTPLGTICP